MKKPTKCHCGENGKTPPPAEARYRLGADQWIVQEQCTACDGARGNFLSPSRYVPAALSAWRSAERMGTFSGRLKGRLPRSQLAPTGFV